MVNKVSVARLEALGCPPLEGGLAQRPVASFRAASSWSNSTIVPFRKKVGVPSTWAISASATSRAIWSAMAFEATSVRGRFDELPDLSEHLVTAPLPELTEPTPALDLNAPTWVPRGDISRDEPYDPSDDDPLVVWNLELDVTASEATTDHGR